MSNADKVKDLIYDLQLNERQYRQVINFCERQIKQIYKKEREK